MRQNKVSFISFHADRWLWNVRHWAFKETLSIFIFSACSRVFKSRVPSNLQRTALITTCQVLGEPIHVRYSVFISATQKLESPVAEKGGGLLVCLAVCLTCAVENIVRAIFREIIWQKSENGYAAYFNVQEQKRTMQSLKSLSINRSCMTSSC